jgi:hypothetical protein
VATKQLCLGIDSLAAENLQILDATINGLEDYRIINILTNIECLDEANSEFQKWELADGRADKSGHYRMVTKLALDEKRIPAHAKIFRISGWLVAAVVCEDVKKVMEKIGCFGAKFIPVT